MKIEWTSDCEITTYQSEDDDEVVRVNAGETETVDILETKQECGEEVIDMQFGNGSMAFAVPTSWFKVIEE